MLAALSRAAAEPAGAPLFAAKAVPGLFPPTAAARQAAQRCKDDGYLRVVTGPGRELCALTEKGMAWLLGQSSPRQVLEDFVRLLEERQQHANDLICAARQMAASLDSLKSAVEQLRPALAADQIHHAKPLAAPRGRCEPAGELTNDIVSQLERWHAAASRDCPLPELYRRLNESHPNLSVGRFHDGLRELHDRHRVYLHPWTGPLYQLPEPPFALLIGHEVAYYASTRS
jgi:hypothetical protein